ncbi:hypothetical protein, partial [Neisseria meningitidis]|uniref:hypothetical protein n=1 Tax=Neisseria meningitidis TaxID=487 RepID=UPI003F78DCA5
TKTENQNQKPKIPSFPRKWESRISDFQITFEYCCCSKVWIPACAGMTAERFLFFPINAAISNPVIPTKVGIQNLGLSDNL